MATTPRAWLARPSSWGWLALGLAVVVRFVIAVTNPWLDGDEAVYGLTALHIARANEPWPAFYWGQSYMGSFGMFVAAPFLRVFGTTREALHAAMGVFWLITLACAARTARLLGLSWPSIALTIVLIITSPMVGFWGFAARGYAETLALSSVLVVWFLQARKRQYDAAWRWFFGWGVLVGGLIWVNALFLPVACACVLVWLVDVVRAPKRVWVVRLGMVVLGFGGGLLPMEAYALTHNSDNFKEVFKDKRTRAERLEAAKVITPKLLSESLPHVLGVRKAWEPEWTWPPLAALVLAGALISWLLSLLGRGRSAGERLLALSMLGVCGAQVVSKHGDFTAEGRYALLLWVAFPVLAAAVVERAWKLRWARPLAVIWLTALAAFHVHFAADWHGSSKPRRLAEAVEKLGLTAVYAGYWDAYPIAFLTDERVIASPRFGPGCHERYAGYGTIVDARARPGFVVTADGTGPQLLARLRELDPQAKTLDVDGTTIVYDFTRDVRPDLKCYE